MHYTIGTWSGLPNYSCAHCPFSTLDEIEMIAHVLERHTPKPEQPEPEPPEESILPATDMPVLLVTSEQLSKLAQMQDTAPQPPRKRARKEKIVCLD